VGVWTHQAGDVKADPEIARGINLLPDGNIALSRQFLKDAHEASQQAQSEHDNDE
jgi:hypothetical protein